MSDAVVVGGGLAGGAAALLLAREGRRVLLLEREREPVDKICGEFLSDSAQRMLAGLDIDLDALGATRMTMLRFVSGKTIVELPLPFVGRGLSRRRLDAVLLDRADATGVQIARGTIVREMSGPRIATSAGELSADLQILASGKHEVRGVPRETGRHRGRTVGFKMYWRLSAAARARLDGRIDVFLFDAGYAGLQLVEGGRANLCLIVDQARLAALGGSWPHLLDHLLAIPQLATLLGDAEPLLPRPLAIAGVPYGFLDRGPPTEQVFRLGDQVAVIPSFCGEGMAIALRSAFLAARIIAKGGTSADHLVMARREFGRRLRLATMLQRLGQHPLSQRLMLGTVRRAPHVAGRLIALTRVPDTLADRMTTQSR